MNVVEKILGRYTQWLWRIVGVAVRLCGRTAPSRFGMDRFGQICGAFIVKKGMFGIKKAWEPVDVRDEWIKVLTALECKHERGRADENQAEVFVLACPVGLTSKKACIAHMSADRAIVRGLGGRLIIGRTIADGEPVCHLTVVRRN